MSLTLADLCDIRSGGTPSRSAQRLYGGSIPWAKIGDLETSDNVLVRTEEFITPEGLAAIRNRIFPAGTLLLAIYGSIGKVAFAGAEMSANQAILGIQVRDRTRLDPRFLFHWLRWKQSSFLGDGAGIAQKNISAAYVRALVVPLPPLAEQERVAAILDQADALRRHRRNALALLDNLAGAIFEKMFDVGRTLPREVPVATLGDQIDESLIGLVRGASEIGPNRPVAYLKMDSIQANGLLDRAKVVRINATQAEVTRYQLRDGDLLFNTRNSQELVGKAAVFRGPAGIVHNNNIMRIRLKNTLLPDFLSAYLRSPFGAEELGKRKSGTTSVFAVYAKSLNTLPVPIFSRDLQERFASAWLKIATQRATFERGLASLDALFASLQFRAFAGEL